MSFGNSFPMSNNISLNSNSTTSDVSGQFITSGTGLGPFLGNPCSPCPVQPTSWDPIQRFPWCKNSYQMAKNIAHNNAAGTVTCQYSPYSTLNTACTVRTHS